MDSPTPCWQGLVGQEVTLYEKSAEFRARLVAADAAGIWFNYVISPEDGEAIGDDTDIHFYPFGSFTARFDGPWPLEDQADG